RAGPAQPAGRAGAGEVVAGASLQGVGGGSSRGYTAEVRNRFGIPSDSVSPLALLPPAWGGHTIAAMAVIDLNPDGGEAFGTWRMGDDEALFAHVATVSLACGFHAGDPVTIERSVALAREHGLAVGAHPGLPDLVGFGRRPIPLTGDEAYAGVLYQVGAVD